MPAGQHLPRKRHQGGDHGSTRRRNEGERAAAMTGYLAPIRDMSFARAEIARLDELATLPGYGDAPPA